MNTSRFPHSEISGSKLTYSYPKHIVVCHVLHRLLLPRHPPCALINLTTNDFNPNLMNFSRFLNNQSFQIELPQKNLHYQVFKEQNSERNNLSKPSKKVIK